MSLGAIIEMIGQAGFKPACDAANRKIKSKDGLACKGPLISVMLSGELVTEADMRNCTHSKKNPHGSDSPG